ncbi:YciI family protein [Bradyrhizobium aeschynomenes]|uniref:YciI family protein n=1 Tax=Bradyrhizobium aeschynomenes TaxID=2734909 RepID=UPI001553CA03|nr:YciI family protein [Bradyrhizobium aeschynomenes]NPV24358.1 YciI family protein [Bradyrhizobium aeschynomenes]
MRFMVIVKATKETEAGILPTTEEFAAMGRFNEELVRAGMMEAGEGLHPTAKGARIDFSQGEARVMRGPFDLSGDLAAGFWMLKAGSLDEVIELMKRAPFPSGQIEIRQVYAAEDFGEAFTPELREQEERLRAQGSRS